MTKDKTSTNGEMKTAKDLKKEEIVYPITFEFKAMMDATINDDDNKVSLVEIFKKHSINYSYKDKKISSKGTYVSFTYEITIISKKIMHDFYTDLKTVKSLKFAL